MAATDLEIFHQELLDAIGLRAESTQSSQAVAFANELASRLENAEVAFDLSVDPVVARGNYGKHLAILGVANDEADDSLVVLVGDFAMEFGRTLTISDANKIFGAGTAFVENCANGWIKNNLEISSKAVSYADDIRVRLASVSSLKFYLISDLPMSDRIKHIENQKVAGKDAKFEIWDLQRFYEMSISSNQSEAIEVKFDELIDGGLPCLASSQNAALTRSYMAIIPGEVLASVFREHGSRLLDSNVRTFLSARGKVNKGIQATLAHEPDRFLAYNNGLTTTATNIETHIRPDGQLAITSLTNWQIVNGGQTTSSLVHYLRQKGERSLNGVSVPMKLVIVDPANSEELVGAISRYANSQNKIDEADFFSNSPYHLAMESISRRLAAPRRDGEQFSTYWFYERARGQYENAKNATMGVARKSFENKYPKTQYVNKTEWAKFLSCWDKRPHEVSRGNQANFALFAKRTDQKWRENEAEFGDQYFRDGVAMAIMYKALRSEIQKAEWYENGYLANLTAYGIAKFRQEVESAYPRYSFSLAKVWENQSVSDEALTVLLDCAEAANRVLTDPNRPQANVTQWAKQDACWNQVSSAPVEFSEDLTNDLQSVDQLAVAKSDAVRERRMDLGIEAVKAALEVPREVWDLVIREGMEARILSQKESDIIRATVLRASLRVPTDRQAAVLVHAVAKAIEEGIVGRAQVPAVAALVASGR